MNTLAYNCKVYVNRKMNFVAYSAYIVKVLMQIIIKLKI
jgi:hypothetical protein